MQMCVQACASVMCKCDVQVCVQACAYACKCVVEKKNGLKMHQDGHLCGPARGVKKCTLNDGGKGSEVKETLLNVRQPNPVPAIQNLVVSHTHCDNHTCAFLTMTQSEILKIQNSHLTKVDFATCIIFI